MKISFIVNFKQFFNPGPVNDILAIFRQNCSVHLRWFCYVNYKDFSTFFVSVYDGMGACSFSFFLFVRSSHFVSVTPLRSLVLLLSYLIRWLVMICSWSYYPILPFGFDHFLGVMGLKRFNAISTVILCERNSSEIVGAIAIIFSRINAHDV